MHWGSRGYAGSLSLQHSTFQGMDWFSFAPLVIVNYYTLAENISKVRMMAFIYGLFLFLHSGYTFSDEQKYSEVKSQTVLILQYE